MSKMPIFLCTTAALLCAAPLMAVETTLVLQQPLSVQPASYEYGDLFAAGEPAPTAANPVAPEVKVAAPPMVPEAKVAAPPAAPAVAKPATPPPVAKPVTPPPVAKPAAPVAPPAAPAKSAVVEDEGYRRCAECDSASCMGNACAACDKCGGAGCNACGCGPWTLPQPCVLQNLGIKVGGWLEQGYTANASSPHDRWNGPVALNDRSNEYEMNQAWLFLDRPTDTGGYGIDLGGHVDIVYGTDWRFGQGWGLEDHINDEDQMYGWVLPQAYGELAISNLKVRAGRFAGLFGYEQVPSVANFFYSHSYSMTYTEPQLVTGVMTDYQLTDQWSIQAGGHRGWYMWEDVNDANDFMGGVRWVSEDKRTQLSYHIDNGSQKNLAQLPNMGDWFAHSFVFERQLTQKTKYVFQHNLGIADRAIPGTLEDAHWYTINQYLFRKLNDRWEAGLRVELMRDEDGFKVAGLASNPDFAGVRAWDGIGYAGNFWEITAGLNYRPTANWVIRPELRYDWYDGPRSWAQNNLPFDDGNKDHQFTAAVDAIVTF